MLEGEIEHRDSVGNKGVIGPGGVQVRTLHPLPSLFPPLPASAPCPTDVV